MAEKFDELKDTAEGAITPEGIAALQQRVKTSLKVASEPPLPGKPDPEDMPGHEFASRDGIRNYAEGLGDRNILFRDADYAANTRWKGMIAHPTMMLYMGVPLRERPLTREEREAGRGGGLPGVHSIYANEEIEWFQPIREGDRLTVRGGLVKAEVKKSDTAGISVHETAERAYKNQRGELVGVGRALTIRYVRSNARERGKHRDVGIQTYTSEDMKRIDAVYEKEEIRGKNPRYWEDVNIGDEITPVVKGPWCVTCFIVFHEGTGHRGPFHRAHSLAYEYRKSHPQAFPLNQYGFPDTIMRVHWDPAMARITGLPTTYDAGVERIAWISHGVTNWMGDDGFLRKLSVNMRNFVFTGDTVWVQGKIYDKYIKDGEYFIELELHGINQKGEDTAPSRAWVLLPSRVGGPVKIPAKIPANISPFA
jgi:acyl dehydratase